MKTTKSILIVLSLVLLTAGTARSNEQAKETSHTLKASCLIQVTSDPAMLRSGWWISTGCVNWVLSPTLL